MNTYIKILFDQLTKEQITILEGLLSGEDALLGHEIDRDSIVTYSYLSELPVAFLNDVASTLDIPYTTEIVEDQNWNATWEAEFSPISIDDFVFLKADFHELPQEHFEHIIHITPKMSFGTGHHDTTQLVMKQMRHLDFSEKRVFDFGTGTGVLAILASILGSSSIVATDNDVWSIENSIENVAKNNCHNILVSDTDITELDTSNPYHIILANINRQILVNYMPQLQALLMSQGTLLLSGFLQEDIPIITSSLQANKLSVKDIKSSNNWVCIEAQKD